MADRNDSLGVCQLNEESYGPKYKDHLIEQYKLFVEMADRVSNRRGIANTFFLTANTVLVSIFGVFISNAQPMVPFHDIWLILFGLAGVAFNLAWMYIVKSYRQLNEGKFKVIHEIERNLPLGLYKSEWIALGEGKDAKLYRPLTGIEIYAPLAFASMYVIILLLKLYYLIDC